MFFAVLSAVWQGVWVLAARLSAKQQFIRPVYHQFPAPTALKASKQNIYPAPTIYTPAKLSYLSFWPCIDLENYMFCTLGGVVAAMSTAKDYVAPLTCLSAIHNNTDESFIFRMANATHAHALISNPFISLIIIITIINIIIRSLQWLPWNCFTFFRVIFYLCILVILYLYLPVNLLRKTNFFKLATLLGETRNNNTLWIKK